MACDGFSLANGFEPVLESRSKVAFPCAKLVFILARRGTCHEMNGKSDRKCVAEFVTRAIMNEKCGIFIQVLSHNLRSVEKHMN